MDLKKHGVVLAALGGLASGAMGQSLSVTMHGDQENVSIGESMTVVMTATFTHPDASYLPYLTVASFDLVNTLTPSFSISNLQLGSWNMDGVSTPGGVVSADGQRIEGLKISQHALFGSPDTTSEGLVIASWTMVRGSTQAFRLSAVDNGAQFALAIADANNSLGGPIVFGVDVVQDLYIPGIPAPGGAGLLAAAGLVCCRRRR